jgi:hypothetical protein
MLTGLSENPVGNSFAILHNDVEAEHAKVIWARENTGPTTKATRLQIFCSANDDLCGSLKRNQIV